MIASLVLRSRAVTFAAQVEFNMADLRFLHQQAPEQNAEMQRLMQQRRVLHAILIGFDIAMNAVQEARGSPHVLVLTPMAAGFEVAKGPIKFSHGAARARKFVVTAGVDFMSLSISFMNAIDVTLTDAKTTIPIVEDEVQQCAECEAALTNALRILVGV